MTGTEYNNKTKQLVDDIKAICAHNGLGGDANEYKIVTQSFLYKFLNDKFLYELSKIDSSLQTYEDLKKVSDNEYGLLLMKLGNNSAHLKPQHLLSYLFSKQDDAEFAKMFDDTLNDIAVTNSAVFSVHTDGKTEIRLFEEQLVQSAISDRSKHNAVAKAIINKLADSKFDFEEIFSAGFDFFSTLFEYMIKDYNKDGGGKYAEYFTPHSVAKVMAEILVADSTPSNAKVYDPSAGSGTLLMNIASKIGTDKCTIYSQDISQKSSNLLRLNLILNGLSHSINNIVQGNTILNNRHPQKMDFIVSNPPFKLDFSEWRDDLESLPQFNERFFAGVPKIMPKSPDKMAIYLLFIQHIMWSLNDTGKAAVVVPTGFITAQNGIEKLVREKLVEKKWLKGVVSMPSNIFATTGTNVSILFIDKTNTGNVVLVDASKLGKKIKDGKNQKTLLSHEDEAKIISAFGTKEQADEFSVVLNYDEIKEKDYSLAAGQYFEVKIEYIDIAPEHFIKKMDEYKKNLNTLFEESRILDIEIKKQLDSIQYEQN
ncbi:N-6 DNA methylase [Candidatus Berkelbacteria bacterium RIFOXYA2_FULL_43_10]|uniref:site-specific DNA-methyltransferase (adenine-specific) n=1 Tax=Candidatus Berkelbacteria bacterium RIFOXYA2_FULL_43_10 TaxID=1797472 RepID=A0A1F5E461_9BACT|nr:MAG: N-6 DNA methylase [Candidatus Berkelbacteria bacterium RIFOXYA2_FULL_43_10]